MPKPGTPTRRRVRWFALMALFVAIAALGAFPLAGLWKKPRPNLDDLPRASVRRISFDAKVIASGRVESRQQTTIECELENLEIRSEGRTYLGGGASTILTVIPDGTTVKKGDILCTLDSSEYEELVRTQVMKVERSRSDKLQAELVLQVAQMAVKEYEEGVYANDIKAMQGQISLGESDMKRWEDRLKWTETMAAKGYVSKSQLTSERLAMLTTKQKLADDRLEREMYERFSAKAVKIDLHNQVSGTELRLEEAVGRLDMQEKRLALYQRMVDSCTIRAPHDGFVMYVSKQFGENRDVIEPGSRVRQRQRLFLLPDLAQMDAIALLHETVVDRVANGMPARVKVEGLPGRVMEGHVTAVAQVPLPNERFDTAKYYQGLVQLDTIPIGLRPGMTAEIEVTTGRRREVLAIPSDAVVKDGDHEICYVTVESGVERREVHLGDTTQDMLEVTSGLAEGEQVLLDPAQIDELSTLVVHPSTRPPVEHPADETSVVTLH